MLDIWSMLSRLPAVAEPPNARAAVLVPLYRDDAGVVRVILTKRPDFMRTHPGDVVFPGGRIEAGEGVVTTAVREAWEEIGLPEDSVEVVGGLAPVTTRDPNNVIVPVVAKVERPSELHPDPAEVDVVIEPPLVELLDDSGWRSSDWMGRTMWFYDFPDGVMWGATAFMMRQLIGLIRTAGVS